MTDGLTLTVGVLFYAVLWASTLGAFRPLSMERSGIYILVTGLGAGLVFGADRFAYDGMALNALAKTLAESAYLALILFLRSVRLPLSRGQEVRGSVLVLLASMLHLTLNVTLTGFTLFAVMAVQIVLLFAWVLRESVLLWRAQPNGMTKMLVVLVALHLTFETVARGSMGYQIFIDPTGSGANWKETLDAWLWVTFSIGYVVLTATASVLMDAFRTDKFRLEQVVQQVEARLQEKETALLSLLATNAERSNDPSVASLAHELKQPLMAIQLNAEYLTSGKRVSQQEVEQILQAILRENQRAATIVQSVRSLFASKAAQQQSVLHLSSWLADWVNLRALALMEKDDVKLQLHVHAEAVVQINAAQLEIVLQNLLGNAVEALVGRAQGRIDITLKTENNMAVIDVIDNGPGLPKGQHERVFEMNYSTKPQGMGFGLWLSRHITQTHGGQLVAVDSETGAHMRLGLPLAHR